MSTVKDAKKALRKDIKQCLSSLEGEAVAKQSLEAQRTLMSLPEYQNASSVSIYLSMPSGEANTDVLVKDAFRSGKAVFVPYMYKITTEDKPEKIMDMLQLNTVEEYIGLAKDNWGIPTLPQAGIDTRENAFGGLGLVGRSVRHQRKLDLIVMPAVAFDRTMRRLGHGAGYYDSFLSRYNDSDNNNNNNSLQKRPFLVGLCLAEQILQPGEHIPVTKFDWEVDAVVSSDGILSRVNTSSSP